MSDISQITINETTYDVKDAVARSKGACWYGTSDTEAATATKAVTCTGYTEAAGSILGVFFSTANTAATPTLSVNNGTERSIYVGGGAPNSTSNVLKWSANTMIYFMWDGTYYRYIGATQSSSVVSSEGATCWWGTSSTAATSRDKTASIANYKPTRGTMVAIRFSVANTYASNSLRLNINSTGVKTVYNVAGATSSSNPLPWAANDTLLFMYDGSYYRYICGSSTYDSYESVPSFSLQAGGNHTLRVECTQKKNGTSTTTVVGEVALVAGDNITLTDDKTSTPSTITVSALPSSMPFVKCHYAGGNASVNGYIRALDMSGSADSPNFDWIGSSNMSSFFEMDYTTYHSVKCLVSGIVEISGRIYFNSTGQQMGVYIYKNRTTEASSNPTSTGTEISSGEWFQATSTNAIREIAGVVAEVQAGDVINLCGRTSSSNAMTNNKDTYLFIKYLEVTE